MNVYSVSVYGMSDGILDCSTRRMIELDEW